MNELTQADYDAASKLVFKNSTKGLGRSAPTRSEALPDGTCAVPMGPVATSERVGLALQYNEYIVHQGAGRGRLVRAKEGPAGCGPGAACGALWRWRSGG